MTAGRPADYKPEYCEQIIELGKQGKSIVQMACALGVVKQTLVNWANEHPEFLAAFNFAKQESQNWWETTGQIYLVEAPGGPKINAGLYSRSMAARFPDDYREKQDLNLGGQPNNPIETKVTVEYVVASKSADTTGV